jgi:hypothetical protein
MNFPFSLYIPRMSTKHDEVSVKQYLEMLRIGIVSRVDFTPINKKPGFGENVDTVVKSAFIHFFDATPGYFGNGFPYSKSFWSKLSSGESCKIGITLDEYWIFLKNTNPVQNTFMNIHQIVENGRHLESLIQEQANMLKEQAKTITKLSNKLEGVHMVVYSIIGGIYNQRTQGESLDRLLDLLLDRNDKEKDNTDVDTSRWTIWPTIRQGDECEERIAVLEKMLGVDSEKQDSELLARKHRTNSWTESEMAIEEQLERDQTWREEDRYEEMLIEAAADRAADMDRW